MTKLVMEPTEIQFWGVVVAVIATIASIVFNVINRHYQRKQLQISTLFQVFEMLSSQDIRDARKFVYDEYNQMIRDGKQPRIFDRTDFVQLQADKVKSSFDRVAVLIHNKLLDEDLFFKIYGGIVMRSWQALEEDIMIDRRSNPVYCENFMKLKEKYEKRYTSESMPKIYQRKLSSS